MAGAEITEVFDVEREKLFQAITDYENYPNFVDGTNEAEVLSQDENGATVRFTIKVVKKFTYTLELKHKSPEEVSWSLKEGDIFKKNEGGWRLEDAGDGKTRVKYQIDADFKVFAPKKLINKLVSQNLPHMINQFVDRAKSL